MPRVFVGTMSWKLLSAACSQRRRSDQLARGLEVRMSRLVGPHLLRGDDDVEIDGEMLARRGEQVVVDVRQDAEPAAGGDEAFERWVGVGERLPRRKAVGEEAGAFGRERPAESVATRTAVSRRMSR